MRTGADIIVGAVLMDNIVYADGTRRDDIPGGAGLYALAGAALFSDEPVLVTGTGRDLPATFGPWLDRNGLTTRGLRFAESVRTGWVNVNEGTNYWESHLPFGGRAGSMSGVGRVGGRFSMERLTELKTVVIDVT